MYTASNKRFYDSKGNVIGKKSFMEGNNKASQRNKLTDDDAITILRLLKSNSSRGEISKFFGISYGAVAQLEFNRTYRHIDRSKIEPYTSFTEESNIEKLEL